MILSKSAGCGPRFFRIWRQHMLALGGPWEAEPPVTIVR
jgi:hypothetical protein